jgi:hypothetical protein
MIFLKKGLQATACTTRGGILYQLIIFDAQHLY